MKSQEEMKSQKEKLNLKKKKKKVETKHFQNSKISELNQYQCQTISVSDDVRI